MRNAQLAVWGHLMKAVRARIGQTRRTSEADAAAPTDVAPSDATIAVDALQARIEHLEQLVESLQDSVHRDSERRSQQLTELEAQVQPAALAVALSANARERGL